MALGTLAVTTHVVPLPALRARTALEEAESLLAASEAPEMSGEGSETGAEGADELLRFARRQLEIAELLGYEDETVHDSLRARIVALERETRSKDEAEGAFARLKKSIASFQTTLFEWGFGGGGGRREGKGPTRRPPPLLAVRWRGRAP